MRKAAAPKSPNPDAEMQTLLISDLPVMVKWKDARASLGLIWYTPEEMQDNLDAFDAHEIISVGVFAGYSKQAITLAMGMGNDQFHTPFAIPRSAIISITQLIPKPQED